ncbi:MAG: hypothetical protein IJ007_08560 [Oscillospiraceae bacterium]|nr:hypothetical protein [Oscillospiraceae bacterium]
MKKTSVKYNTPKKCAENGSRYITYAVTDNKTLKDGSVVNRSEENARIARETSEDIKL